MVFQNYQKKCNRKKTNGKFKNYEIGFLHIDITFSVPHSDGWDSYGKSLD